MLCRCFTNHPERYYNEATRKEYTCECGSMRRLKPTECQVYLDVNFIGDVLDISRKETVAQRWGDCCCVPVLRLLQARNHCSNRFYCGLRNNASDVRRWQAHKLDPCSRVSRDASCRLVLVCASAVVGKNREIMKILKTQHSSKRTGGWFIHHIVEYVQHLGWLRPTPRLSSSID